LKKRENLSLKQFNFKGGGNAPNLSKRSEKNVAILTDKEKALKNLGLTDKEIADVIETDKKIDKGEKLFELPEELEKGAKKARSAGNCKGYTKPKERTKTADPDKGKLIADLLDGIPYAENVEIVNYEREFTFTFRDKKYKVVLSCPRK
jgi:hypothetical protein